MRIGDEWDDRGEQKDTDFRRNAAAQMGLTTPDPDVPDPTEGAESTDGQEDKEKKLPETVRDVGLSVLGNIADAGR